MKRSEFLTKLVQNRTEFSKNWKTLVNQLETDRSKNSALNRLDAEETVPKKRRRLNNKKKRAMKLLKNSNSSIKMTAENTATTTNELTENGKNSDAGKNPVSYASVVKKCLDPIVNEKESKPENSKTQMPKLTKCLAIDCEFVGLGEYGSEDAVARVSLVNLFGDCVYDKYVKPEEEITDYRTRYSGIRPENLINACSLRTVQKEVSDLIKGRILIGHSVHKDLKVLFLYHPRKDLRDTSTYTACRMIAKTKRPSLKKLALLILGTVIQEGEHNSVIDARVAMQLYRTYRQKWEASCQKHFSKKRIKQLKHN